MNLLKSWILYSCNNCVWFLINIMKSCRERSPLSQRLVQNYIQIKSFLRILFSRNIFIWIIFLTHRDNTLRGGLFYTYTAISIFKSKMSDAFLFSPDFKRVFWSFAWFFSKNYCFLKFWFVIPTFVVVQINMISFQYPLHVMNA